MGEEKHSRQSFPSFHKKFSIFFKFVLQVRSNRGKCANRRQCVSQCWPDTITIEGVNSFNRKTCLWSQVLLQKTDDNKVGTDSWTVVTHIWYSLVLFQENNGKKARWVMIVRASCKQYWRLPSVCWETKLLTSGARISDLLKRHLTLRFLFTHDWIKSHSDLDLRAEWVWLTFSDEVLMYLPSPWVYLNEINAPFPFTSTRTLERNGYVRTKPRTLRIRYISQRKLNFIFSKLFWSCRFDEISFGKVGIETIVFYLVTWIWPLLAFWNQRHRNKVKLDRLMLQIILSAKIMPINPTYSDKGFVRVVILCFYTHNILPKKCCDTYQVGVRSDYFSNR